MEVERKGKTKIQEGKEEDAYVLYSRAMTIYLMISESIDDEFKQSRGGQLFYETSQRLCVNFDKVAVSLQQRFMDGQGELPKFCDPLGLRWAEIVENPISENLGCGKDSNSLDAQNKIQSILPKNKTALPTTEEFSIKIKGNNKNQISHMTDPAIVDTLKKSEKVEKLIEESGETKKETKEKEEADEKQKEEKNEEEARPNLKLMERILEWQKVNSMNPIWKRRHAELDKTKYTKFYNSITKDFDMPFGHLRFSENAMPKSILYVPKTLVAHPFQNQDLAFSSGTMKFSAVTPLAESLEPHHSDAEFAIYSKTRGPSFLEAGDVVLVTV
ncbi:hypothetical protein niasHT_014533 [Heterodera trifolii]|uniref:Uncharacterized protein n=1 Tax=Heterodera trifolii TaxID=157864 RepID=A0ABD2L565_9BILA